MRSRVGWLSGTMLAAFLVAGAAGTAGAQQGLVLNQVGNETSSTQTNQELFTGESLASYLLIEGGIPGSTGGALFNSPQERWLWLRSQPSDDLPQQPLLRP